MKELNDIQVSLSAPKNQTNQFGNYNYRSLESIMEAVKPLLKKSKCTITFSDELVMIGNRYYVKSTCFLKNEAGEIETSTAFAREQESKKGMDEAQITGSASSYARKYAACSLLGIDDNREPDMCDNREEGTKTRQARQLVKDEIYWKCVTTHAKGWKGEKGETARDIWKDRVKATQEWLNEFDDDTALVKESNNAR